mgnify:CR=1 FL=1
MAKVLVATEDLLAQDQMVATIEAEGYDAVTANDGMEAQDVALKEQPDLILLEPKLAVFDGLETALALRDDPEIPDTVPIVMITDEPVDPHKVERFRITELFPKTHGSIHLRDMVIRLLGDKAGI